jgi:hypothetical protein
MQATVVMLIALGGLGCQNPVSDLPPFLPDVRQSAGQPSTEASPVTSDSPASSQPSTDAGSVTSASPAPTAYPVYGQGPSGYPETVEDESFGTCMRNTFCSFFIGRDPGIPTAAEIEAAYHSSHSNQ